MFRMGIGYDVHRLVARRKLFLGGILIPHKKGASAHSDGDVLLHAVCDALLGAAGLGDIGEHFPDSAKEYKDISSTFFLKKVSSLISRRGFSVQNIDTVVIAQEPKISPFKKAMRANIARTLGIDSACVNIKATTAEGLGELGKCKGIAAFAVATIRKKR